MITPPRPLLSCLQILIDSSETTATEKCVFQEVRDDLTSKLAIENSGGEIPDHEVFAFISHCASIQALTEDDRKARLDHRKTQPSKTSKDAVMDDQMTDIPQSIAYAVQKIHETLVLSCHHTLSYKYKEGHFASDIVMSRPILSCFQCLIDSSKSTKDEKAIFVEIKERLIALTAQEANGEIIGYPEMAHLVRESRRKLRTIFENDKKTQFFKTPKNTMMAVPEAYKGNHPDGPSTLLMFSHQIIILGVKDASYLNSQLTNNIAINMDVLHGLSFLSINDIVPPPDQAVFEAAKLFAQKLKDLKVEGILNPEPNGILHYEFVKWFDPVLKVFDDDADSRRAQRATWPTFVITENSFDPNTKILMEFARGRGLPRTSGGAQNAGKENIGGGKKGSAEVKKEVGKGSSGLSDGFKANLPRSLCLRMHETARHRKSNEEVCRSLEIGSDENMVTRVGIFESISAFPLACG